MQTSHVKLPETRKLHVGIALSAVKEDPPGRDEACFGHAQARFPAIQAHTLRDEHRGQDGSTPLGLRGYAIPA